MPRREWLVRGHTDHGGTRVSLTLRSLCSTPFLKHTTEKENKQKPWLGNQLDLTAKSASHPVTLGKRLDRQLPHGNDNRDPRQCEHDIIDRVPGMPVNVTSFPQQRPGLCILASRESEVTATTFKERKHAWPGA